MNIFYTVSALILLAVILTGYLMDRSAIRQRINGANGLPVLAALVVSFGGSILVSFIAALVDGWTAMGWVLVLSVACHAALGRLLIGRLQGLATEVSAQRKR